MPNLAWIGCRPTVVVSDAFVFEDAFPRGRCRPLAMPVATDAQLTSSLDAEGSLDADHSKTREDRCRVCDAALLEAMPKTVSVDAASYMHVRCRVSDAHDVDARS